MSFSPLHIWAAMGPLSKVIAGLLLMMATMSLAVVVERQVSLFRARRETKKLFRAVIGFLESGEYEKAVTTADAHPASPFARLIAPVLRKLSSSGEDNKKNLPPVELARREAERQ